MMKFKTLTALLLTCAAWAETNVFEEMCLEQDHFRSDASIYGYDPNAGNHSLLLVDHGQMADLSHLNPYDRTGQESSARSYLDHPARMDPAQLFDGVRAIAATLPDTARSYLPQELQPGSHYAPDPVVTPDPIVTPKPTVTPKPADPTQPQPLPRPALGQLAHTDCVNTETHLRTSGNQANYVDLSITGRLLADGLTGVKASCGSASAQDEQVDQGRFALSLPLSFQGRQPLDLTLSTNGSCAMTSAPGEAHAHTEAYVDGHWIVMDATWDTFNKYSGGQFHKELRLAPLYFDISTELFAMDHMLKEPRVRSIRRTSAWT